jgi:hypothetical protein
MLSFKLNQDVLVHRYTSWRSSRRHPTRAGRWPSGPADPQEMFDRLVIATPRGHQAVCVHYKYNGHEGFPQSTWSNEPGPMAGCPSSDSDDRSLHISGPGQPAWQRHSTAPNGVGRRTLVHMVAHEHLVHTKVLNFPDCIKD